MILKESDKLSPDQKLELLTLLWEAYREKENHSLELTDEEWNEIERREAEYAANREETLT